MSRWEWVSAGLGLAMLIATLVILLTRGLDGANAPPSIVLRTLSISPVSSGWVVEFEAHNESRKTAAELRIIGELTVGDSLLEQADIVLDYLPGHSRRQGGLYFTRDPHRGLRLRPVSYREP